MLVILKSPIVRLPLSMGDRNVVTLKGLSRTTAWRRRKEAIGLRRAEAADTDRAPSALRRNEHVQARDSETPRFLAESARDQAMDEDLSHPLSTHRSNIELNIPMVLSTLRSGMLSWMTTFRPALLRLVFRINPVGSTPSVQRPLEDLLVINSGRLSLAPDHPHNAEFLEYERYLHNTRVTIQDLLLDADDDSTVELLNLFDTNTDELERLENLRVEAWNRQRVSTISQEQLVETGTTFVHFGAYH